MPFVSNMNEDDEKQNGPQGSQGGPVSPSGGGAVRLAPSAGVQSGGGGAAGAGASPASAGGQFASLNQYLKANQGQAEPLANKITSGIGQQYNTLSEGNASTLKGIGDQVSSNAVPTNYQDTLTQEAANPVSFASNASNVPSFQKLLGATYSGPTSAESTDQYQKQQAAVNNAIAQGQASTQTEAGRENLLKQNEKTPTTGVTALNSAILSKSPTALGNVENAYKPFSNLVSGLSTGAQGINQNIANTQKDVTTANTAANKQISDQVNALNTGLTTTADQATAKQNEYNKNLQAEQTQGAPANAALNDLSSLMKQYFPGAQEVTNPFSSVLSNQASNAQYTPANVATADQYAQAQAFKNLLGNLNLPAPLISADTASQAGTGVVPTTNLAPLSDLAAQANKQFAVGQPLGSIPLTSYQDTQNWQNTINPAWQNVLQQLNKLNPAVWAPK